MGLGPFDLPGHEFLTLYAILLIIAVVAGMIIPSWLRPEGRASRVTDPEQLAFLAGGVARLVDAAVARLLAAGALVMEGKTRFRVAMASVARSDAERSILALSSPASWSAVSQAASRRAAAVKQALVQRELLLDGATTMQLRFWQSFPYPLLLGFGAIKWEIGSLRDRPVGILTGLLILTAVLAALRFAIVDRRTRAGKAAVAHARDGAERLSRAPIAEETGLAVALFGTGVLSGSAWSDYHALRAASGGDGSASSDGGGSDGGGGCGGGGCGGCGS